MIVTEGNLVEGYTTAIQQTLAKARQSKPLGEIEPPLATEFVEECIVALADASHKDPSSNIDVKPNYAAIETSCRDIFYNLLSLNAINDAKFGDLWSLLDLVSSLSDRELCEPSLIFWLVEELLDSQTINGCRIVFDYLDSRRDRLTAQHFKEKSLAILRTCNELLRRLSRAEDTVFCGRVFIFLFQSFPLGDKSSVNLRGEYHVENVTKYETLPPKEEITAIDGMEVDHDEKPKKIGDSTTGNNTPASEQPATESGQTVSSVRSSKSAEKATKQEDPEPDLNQLYESFWSLQDFFSQPTKLFDSNNLSTFKTGLRSTMRKFRDVQKGLQSKAAAKPTEESKRGVKRKRSSQQEDISGAFNPKYLTSRELFELEIRDLTFRRHIMVQTLIVLDFLLSLNPKSKKKLEGLNNRAVLYSYTLSDDDLKWATIARAEIGEYLLQGPEGKFYYRTVDTVLSRDKNWTHWKAESCPLIAMDPVSADDFGQAMKGIQRSCTNKRLKSNPMGALDLTFLTETRNDNALESLKNPERYTVRTVESFERPIADDQFEIEMSSTAEEKELAENAKASKLWRTLRVASKNSLKCFDKFDDGKNLDALFHPDAEESSQKTEAINEEAKEIKETQNVDEKVQKSETAEAPVIDTATASSETARNAENSSVKTSPKDQVQPEPLEAKAEVQVMEGFSSTDTMGDATEEGPTEIAKQQTDV